jgi:F420-dependent oxidoreductase-like protein
MRVGVKLFGQGRTVDDQTAVWRAADAAGFDHCWVSDHLVGINGDAPLDVLEGWSMLGAMATITKRVRIGCMVTANTFRHPGLLAKMAVTIDHLSGGRLEFGIGAAWSEPEHTMLGLEFGSAGERLERLSEACHVLKLLWTQDVSSFSGRHYQLTNAIGNPKPVQNPYPPLWIGGVGERKTLRVVAEHADVWNAPGGDPDEVARLSAVLDDHCRAIGRDPATIRRSVQFRFEGDPQAAVASARAYASHGISDVVMVLMGSDGLGQAEAAVDALKQLKRAG